MSHNKPHIAFLSLGPAKTLFSAYTTIYNVIVSHDAGAGALRVADVPGVGGPGQAHHHLGHALGEHLQVGGEHEAGVQHKQPMVPLYLGNPA